MEVFQTLKEEVGQSGLAGTKEKLMHFMGCEEAVGGISKNIFTYFKILMSRIGK